MRNPFTTGRSALAERQRALVILDGLSTEVKVAVGVIRSLTFMLFLTLYGLQPNGAPIWA